MKREQISWLQKLIRRLTTSSLVTVWTGVNSNRNDLYFPFLSEARQKGQDVSEAGSKGQPERGQNAQDEFGQD